MKRILLLLSAIILVAVTNAQIKIKDKKYPSLLWEISGKGMTRPSYLIGTMHVSSKMAFHLPDSFYIALRSAKVVALETNPETWQDDMNKYDVSGGGFSFGADYSGYQSSPNDFLHISTLKFYKYEKKIEKALYSSPSVINNLLYRTYGNDASDFEEDTYLDMYIYQCGKRLGKKVSGVEDYGESMRLMVEAYKDAAKDKSKKQRSYDGAEDYSGTKLQEAYRNGNLDLLDSINKYNSTSAAFDEKFLYRRNEIQANSIDSIMKSGSSLFVGVGAAHLPGDRGVIELLRKKGYKLRPVKMGERDSRDKDIIEKIRVPVTFKATYADDSLFKVDIPGKLYATDENPTTTTDERQYADMANGSYYMVTRIMTNALMWGHSSETVMKKVDSLLYENIPGKILSRSNITRNGYKGIELTNRTRRGDMQRYNIFVTPFEVIIFKMSGNSDYVKNGEEANKFFGSIQFKEYKNGTEPAAAWKKYSPVYGGFAIDLPHEPYIGNDGSWIYDAEDKTTNTQYRIIRSDIHNFHFAEEDTFDLGLMSESFMASEFIDSQYYRKQTTYKGYPALDVKFRDKSGNVFLSRFLIQGPHYYTLAAHGKQETQQMSNFLNSFEIKPFVYGEAKQQKDTTLYYTVTTPVYPQDKKIKLEIPRYSYFGIGSSEEDEKSEDDQLEAGAYRDKVISNDTTGEKIYISFDRVSRYHYSDDSTDFDKENEHPYADSTWIYKMRNKTTLSNKMKVWETIATDSGSSRAIWAKTFYKDGITFSIATETDTLTKPSTFIRKFFDSFTPADTLKGVDPFTKKSNLFFDDFMSKDSVLHKRAVAAIDDIDIDSTDLPRLKKVIASLNWDEKKYLDTKKSLISKLGDITTSQSADYLKELYYALDDTVSVQYTVLENLLQHKTAYAYNIFRNIINTEPPVKETNYNDYSYDDYAVRGRRGSSGYLRSYSYDNGDFMDELSDSLQLTKTILPDLLPLLNLDDYKDDIMKLLGEMVDSSVLKPADYEMYYSKFMLEARQELKKQSIAEKKKAIEKAEESKDDKNMVDDYYTKEEDDYGNDDLSLYANLLLPFWDSKPAVQPLLQQMFKSGDKRLKYNTMLLLLKHDKPFPDTLLNYFAKLDEYRYELYSDLKQAKKFDKFPKFYNNHLDLGKSSLLSSKSYDKPDSVVFVERLPAEYMNKKGFVYFYKYKDKKDDMTWKLATVGLIPEAPDEFEFADSIDTKINLKLFNMEDYSFGRSYLYDFTGFTETKISEDEPLMKQLGKALKKLLYSRRKSAEEFYEDENDRSDMTYGNFRF